LRDIILSLGGSATKPPELPEYDHQVKHYSGPSLEEVMDMRMRYLTPSLVTYYEKPGDLSVCYFVNSGSKANDLALLMACLYTGNYDVDFIIGMLDAAFGERKT